MQSPDDFDSQNSPGSDEAGEKPETRKKITLTSEETYTFKLDNNSGDQDRSYPWKITAENLQAESQLQIPGPIYTESLLRFRLQKISEHIFWKLGAKILCDQPFIADIVKFPDGTFKAIIQYSIGCYEAPSGDYSATHYRDEARSHIELTAEEAQYMIGQLNGMFARIKYDELEREAYEKALMEAGLDDKSVENIRKEIEAIMKDVIKQMQKALREHLKNYDVNASKRRAAFKNKWQSERKNRE
jgi:hypothetical protein